MKNHTLEDLVAFAKRRGFVFQTSDIYGGLTTSYDYGPAGVELMNNIKRLWWREFVTKRPDMVGLDSQILLHPDTWVASGHVDSFTDPLVEDKVSNKRYRADHLIEDWIAKQKGDKYKDFVVEDLTVDEMAKFIADNKILSPDGNPVTEPKDFKLLFETAIGAVAGEKSTAYMRGETAQGIFTNFKNVLDSTRVQLPFGVAQVGTSFRNEITTGQFIFRTLEFQQAEIEYFFDPEKDDWQELFQSWRDAMWSFVIDTLGVSEKNVSWRRHTDKERSHYSKDTYDLDYRFPFGSKELWGIAYRTDYDLKQHQDHSGKSLEYTDPHDPKRKFLPHVIEPALGLNRVLLMLLSDCLTQVDGRRVLKLKPELAPYKAAVFPLLANKPKLVDKAQTVFNTLIDAGVATAWDARGNIGKRYLSQDELGTPNCITVDFDTLEDDTVTIRERDTAEQKRVKIEELTTLIKN